MAIRYRRLSSRYTMIVSNREPTSLTDIWWMGGVGKVLEQPHWRPAADIYETGATIVVCVELAGVADEELEVLLYEDALVVEGRRSLAGSGEAERYHAVGIRQGPFRLEVRLPAAVDSDAVEARYERGLLVVRLQKVEGG